jgi:CHAT domain-containing protein
MKNLNSKLILCLLFFLSMCIASAQLKPKAPLLKDSPYNSQYQRAIASKDYTTAKNAAISLCNQYYRQGEPYSLLSQALYNNGEQVAATNYSDWAVGFFSYDFLKNYHGFVQSVYAKDKVKVRMFLRNMQSVGVDNATRDNNLLYLNNYLKSIAGYTDYKEMIAWTRNELSTFNEDSHRHAKTTYMGLASSLGATTDDIYDKTKAQKILNDWIAAKPEVENGNITREIYVDALSNLSVQAEIANYTFGQTLQPYQQEIVFDQKNYRLPSRYRTYTYLAYAQAALKRWDQLKSSSNFILSDLKGNVPVVTTLAKPYFYLIMAETELENYAAAAAAADAYVKIVPQFNDPEMVAEAYYVILRAYAYNKDIEKGRAVLAKAKQFMADPALSKQEYASFVKNGISTTSSILENQVVELTDNHYNNGIRLVASKDLKGAALEFELAQKEQIEKLNNMSSLEQRGHVPKLQRTNSQLAAIYQELKQYDKIYDVIENNRAYSLVNNKRSKKAQVSLKELQASLQPDETYLSLIDISNGSTYDGTYMMCLVKKNKVYTRYNRSAGPFTSILENEQKELIALEKELAQRELRTPNLDYLTGKKQRKDGYFGKGEFTLMVQYLRKHMEAKIVDGQYVFFQKEQMPYLLNSFYNAFINGLEEELVGINKITISPEGVTSAIPFDALMDFKGNYLASRFEIGYIPNAAMLVGLRNQPKRTYSKNVLAFGGATYELHSAPKAALSSLGDLEKIRYRVNQSIEKEQPLDYAFATFQGGEPMGYLQGGRREVVLIGDHVAKVDTRLDDMMTENELKRMSKAGELGNYKAIHLSSHASVHQYVFDLSSFAMTVKPTPVNGEDGMIVVSEMEKLDLPVDFVMLSACQTALGIDSPGDGIRGFNQALFNAGANSTLTSLWSVSDSGTMYLSIELYDRMFNKNLSTTTALYQVKRNFINGVYGDQTHPYFWAPFIYTGY